MSSIENLKRVLEVDKEEHVKKIAYFLWIDAGRPGGRDLEFWLLAEKKYESEKKLDTFKTKSFYFFNDCYKLKPNYFRKNK